MKFRNFAVAAAGAFFLALSSYAQITAIEGDVKGPDGTPAALRVLLAITSASWRCVSTVALAESLDSLVLKPMAARFA